MKLAASEGKLDKLRPDGIHIKRDGASRITHSVIFEITRANDLFANFWGYKVAQKTLRSVALRVAEERATGAPCCLSKFVLGICASFLERDWRLALVPYDLEATNQIFCAVSHAALGALADQWKTRNVARYLAQSQASRLLSNGSVQEGDREAHIRLQCGWGCC